MNVTYLMNEHAMTIHNSGENKTINYENAKEMKSTNGVTRVKCGAPTSLRLLEKDRESKIECKSETQLYKF